MKRFTLFFLLFFIPINAQSLKAGAAANFLIGNKYLDYQFGPSIFVDYPLKGMPLIIQGNIRFYLSELSNEENFSGGYTYKEFNVGGSINYYPIDWVIEPYIGLGVFYNFNNLSLDGILSPSYDGTTRSANNIENNFSTEITGGIKFSASTPINFIVEITQTFNKPTYALVTWSRNSQNNLAVNKKKFNFNSLMLRMGLLFRI